MIKDDPFLQPPPTILNIIMVFHTTRAKTKVLIDKWPMDYSFFYLLNKIEWLYLNFYQLSSRLNRVFQQTILHLIINLAFS